MIKVKNESDKTVVYVSGDIEDDSWRWADGFFGADNVATYPEDIREMLTGVTGPVEVRISSGGGDLFAGMAISNILSRYDQGKTKAVIDGLAASAASVIAFGCDEIEMPSNAYLMIHKPSVGIYGDSDLLLKWADTLDSLQEGIVTTYLRHTKEESKDKINDMVNAETWLTGEKAKDIFNLTLSDPSPIPQNVGTSVQNYTHTPSIFKNSYEEDLKKEIDEALKMY